MIKNTVFCTYKTCGIENMILSAPQWLSKEAEFYDTKYTHYEELMLKAAIYDRDRALGDCSQLCTKPTTLVKGMQRQTS